MALMLLTGGAFSSPAVAQTAGTVQPDTLLYTAQAALLLLGMAFAAYWAYEAFDTPPIKLGDGPTLPRYMTQPTQYRLGVIAYVGVCLLVYALIAYFHRDLLPLVGAVMPDLYKTIEHSMTDGSLTYPLVVIFSAAIFVTLLKVEKDWNPLFVLRRIVHGWVSIPQFVNAIMVMARDELLVPAEARAGVTNDPDAPYVTVGDFDKDRRSLDRHWAELCYVRLWLEHYRAQGSHFTFFNEPSFAWEQLQTDYDNLRDRVAPLKRGEVSDPNIFADVAGKVEALRRQHCRLAACFLVFKNQTQKNALRDAKQFGVTITLDVPRANPLRYTAIFLVAIMISIYLGVSLSAMSWDLLHGNLNTALTRDPDLITWWIGYALAIYGMPILAILLLRYLGWTIDPGQPNSYLVSYATIFLVALSVSVTCLAIAIKLAGTTPAAGLPFSQLVVTRLKWGISPAIVAVYIAYHVDRQIDPLLPDIGSYEHWRLTQRLMSCIFFGFFVAGFSALPTLSITVSFTAWPVDKQRTVVIGTIFIIGLMMALAGC
ncbi:MAG TPA: hypothetical protein VHQ03_12325 [Candidatus Dormibacteraeota bacterium]|nr:hypothetical protein [Candidatus Dormibacteraeota bacterium]